MDSTWRHSAKEGIRLKNGFGIESGRHVQLIAENATSMTGTAALVGVSFYKNTIICAISHTHHRSGMVKDRERLGRCPRQKSSSL